MTLPYNVLSTRLLMALVLLLLGGAALAVAPTLTPINGQSVREGETLNIVLTATDDDGDAVTFSTTNLPGFCTLTDNTGPTGGIECNPGGGDAGNFPNITVTATDDSGPPAEFSSDNFNLTVTENAAPSLSNIGNQTVEEGGSLSIPLNASDTDGVDVMSFSITGFPATCVLDDNGDGTGSVDCNPVDGDAGTYTAATVTVTDNAPFPLQDADTFTLTIGANTAPSLTPIADQSVAEGASLNISLVASDGDGDNTTFTTSALPAFCSLADATGPNGTISCNPGAGTGGITDITVTVTDDGVIPKSASDIFRLTVSANAAPVLTAIAAQSVAEGDVLNIPLGATDADVGDAVTFSTTNLPGFCTLTDNTGPAGAIACNPGDGDASVTLVTVTATDDAVLPGSDTTQFQLTVTANTPPVLTPIADQSVAEGASLNISLVASDGDGDNTTFTTSALPAFCSLADATGPNGTISCNPGAGNGGITDITVTVTDDGVIPKSASDIFRLTVSSNAAPVLTAIAAQSVAEGDVLNITLGATDADAGDAVTFSTTNLPGFCTVTDNTGPSGAIACNPGAGDASVTLVTVTATDDAVLPGSDAKQFQLTVTANTPPVLTPIADQSMIEGEVLNIPLSATDTDGDVVTFSTTGLPAFCTLTDANGPTGAIDCSPLVGNDGAFLITVTARDDGVIPASASDSFTLNVGANQAPTVSGVTITGVPALGELLTGTYNYADTEGDVEGISTFRWLRDGSAIPGATDSTYTVAAADIETSLIFEVTPVAQAGAITGTPGVSPGLLINNSAPSITGQVVLETPEETALTIVVTNLTVADADSTFPDDFTLTVLDSPDAIPSYTRSGAGGNTITPVLNLNGLITVPVTVNDGFEDSTVFNLQVNVTEVNDLPTFVGVVPPGLTTPEDTTLTIVLADLVITDPDNLIPDELTLELSPPGPADNYTLAGATAITPALNFNGQLSVIATVSDLEGASAPFVIPVDVDPVNDLPVLVAPIGPQQAVEGSPFSLDIKPNFSDDDVSDTLGYTADWSPVKPPNINFNAVTGVFSGTPRLVDADPPGPIYTVIVTATDSEDAFVSDTFDLTINALGRANLNMTIDVSPATALPSEELRWTFTTNNPIGPVAGENVQITGSFFGAGITVTAVGAVNCTLDVQPAASRTDFSCDVGSVPVGGSPSIAFTTTTTVATEIVAFGTAAGAQPVPIDPNEDDNSDLIAAGVAESFSTLPTQDLGTTSIRSVAAGDVNGDGAADIVVGTMSGQPVQVYFADALRESCNCQRDFLSVPISIPDTGSNTGVALGDFDGNGTLDLVVANGGDQDDVVYSNDGNGNFSPRHTLGPSNANDVAVGDFNNDGNLDIVVAASSPNLVYFGNGNGAFGNAIPLGDNDSRSVAVGRFDNNNRMDIAFANVAANSTVYTKNAGGTGFTLRDRLAIGDAAAVAAGDLNGDGIDDLVFGRIATNIGDIPSNPVLINAGNGTFGGALTLLGLSPTREVLIGDVNEDGSPDLVFISSSGVHQLWVASGGTYTLHSEQIMDLDAGSAVLANLGEADDGDPGGVDLAMGGRGNAGVGVWLNDSQGNLGLGDAVAPTLTLNGEASVSIPAKSSYVDAGATAMDNIDGNISPSIIVGNSVNTSIVGSYTVTYNVQDRAGNTAAQISRSVSVTPASGGGGGGGGGVSYWLLALLLTVLALRKTTMNKSRIHGVMAVSALLLLTSVGPAKAQEVRYSWLDLSVIAQDVDRGGVQVPIPGQSVEAIASDGSGVRFRGSLGTWKNMYLLVSYGSTDIDVDAIVTNEQGVFETNDEFDFTAIRGGIGVKWSIFQKTDLFAEVTYDSTDLDFGSFAGENFDANAQDVGGALGFRTMFGDHFEMKIAGRYTQVGDVDLNTLEFDDDTLYSVGFAWEVIRGFSIVGDYESGEFSSYGLGFRLDLSED